ncbi:MAG: NTPase [Candidatus Promineifilaceae bacterium]|nr:NTPase [Candidatus Promineifilaceae bacterium]
MDRHILITGRPGSGKTTLIRRVVKKLPYPAHGFYTKEIRQDGRRQGFALVTLTGQRGLLAHVKRSGSPRVGRYGVDVSTLQQLGVKSIEQAIEMDGLIVIDEIGPMELLSDPFRQIVRRALNGDKPVLATIVSRSLPFADQIKTRPDVTLITVSPNNRDRLAVQITERLEMILTSR